MTTAPLSTRRLFDVLDYLVDDHLGIIRYVAEVSKDPGDPDFFHFYARACNTKAFCPQQNFGDTGGASVYREIALAKAVGEAVERYCAAIFDNKELDLHSFDAAPFECVEPTMFALYCAEQYAQPHFPYRPFTSSTPVRWTSAVDLLTGRIVYVPAAMVYIPYFFSKEETAIVQPISTGLACHSSFEEAALSAIYEVIERDAFMITWQARLGMPQVQIDSLSRENRDLVERFHRTESRVITIDITMEHGVPTFLSILRSFSEESPALVFAASADLCPQEAIRKSLEECAHTRRHARHLKSSIPSVVQSGDFRNVTNQTAHVRMYCDQDNAGWANFIWSSSEICKLGQRHSVTIRNPWEDLQVVVSKLVAHSHRVLIADITSPEIRELGLHVVRAIIPGFHPLFMGHAFRSLGGKRLFEIPEKLGYTSVSRKTGDNPAPHPYP